MITSPPSLLVELLRNALKRRSQIDPVTISEYFGVPAIDAQSALDDLVRLQEAEVIGTMDVTARAFTTDGVLVDGELLESTPRLSYGEHFLDHDGHYRIYRATQLLHTNGGSAVNTAAVE